MICRFPSTYDMTLHNVGHWIGERQHFMAILVLTLNKPTRPPANGLACVCTAANALHE